LKVLAATWGDGLFVVAGERRDHELAGESVRGLAHDGRGGALAIVGGHSLRRRSPAGEWGTLAEDDAELACVVAFGEDVLVGTDHGARLLRATGGGGLEPLAGFDAVPGRERWYAGTAVIDGRVVGPPLGVRSLSAAPRGGTVLAAVHVGGIPRSTDGGASWLPTLDIDSDVHEVCVHPTRPDRAAAATALGLGISRDGGATWSIETQGLHALYCSAVAFVGDDVLVAAADDHFAGEGALYRRSLDGGAALAPVALGPSARTAGIVDTACIAVNGADLAVADKVGHLYVSSDGGRTWSTCGDMAAGTSALLLV
jgi:hypothetical protein